jgi:hypothetical protein
VGSEPPTVAVFNSPLACRWLTSVSVAYVPLTAEELETSTTLPRGGVLVVPLDRVWTEGQARRIAEFAAGGGKLLAVYWGPLVREDARSRHPVYSLGPVLGVRPAGWRGADPLVVRPGDSAGSGAEIVNLRLPRAPLVRVEPLDGAAVLARWARPTKKEAAEQAPGEGPLAVAFGGHLYLALDLLAPQTETAEARQIFLWALNSLAPGLVTSQARERADAAMAAVMRSETALEEAQAARPDGDFKALREKLAEARDLATRARQAAAIDRAFEATAQAVRAHALAEEVLKALRTPAEPGADAGKGSG